MRSFKFYKIVAAIALFMTAIFMFAACAANNGSAPDGKYDPGSGSDNESIRIPETKTTKLIYTVYATLEAPDLMSVPTKLDEAIESINKDAEKQSSISNVSISITEKDSTAYYVFKIYTPQLNMFYSLLEEIGTEISRRVTAVNAFEKTGTQSVIERLTAEIESMQQQLAKIDPVENHYTWMQYNNKILDKQNELEAAQATLDIDLDRLDYSTLTLNIYSTGKAPAEKTYNTKLEEAFMGSLNFMLDILKFLLLIVAFILPVGVLVGGATFGGLKLNKAYRKKYPKKVRERRRDFYTHNKGNPRYMPKDLNDNDGNGNYNSNGNSNNNNNNTTSK